MFEQVKKGLGESFPMFSTFFRVHDNPRYYEFVPHPTFGNKFIGKKIGCLYFVNHEIEFFFRIIS